MRPWIIVVSGTIGATAVTAALAIRESVDLPPSEFAAHLPALAVAALAVYALCTMLMVTATLLAGILRIRRDVETTGLNPDPGHRDWVEAFGGSGLGQLALKLGLGPAPGKNAELRHSPGTRFSASEMRSEFARLYYISLARAHFFSALVVLAGIVGLGVAQERGSLPFSWGTIPTTSGTLVLVGLVLLTVLSRIAFDVTAEPLLETIPPHPVGSAELDLLRRTLDLLERAGRVTAVPDERAAATFVQPREELIASLEQGHRTLLEAVAHLSANTQALEAAMQSSAEAIETSIRTVAAQQRLLEAEQSAHGGTAFPELRAAVEELTAVLQRLSAAPGIAEGAVSQPGPAPLQRPAAPSRLAGELRSLLQEIDANR